MKRAPPSNFTLAAAVVATQLVHTVARVAIAYDDEEMLFMQHGYSLGWSAGLVAGALLGHRTRSKPMWMQAGMWLVATMLLLRGFVPEDWTFLISAVKVVGEFLSGTLSVLACALLSDTFSLGKGFALALSTYEIANTIAICGTLDLLPRLEQYINLATLFGIWAAVGMGCAITWLFMGRLAARTGPSAKADSADAATQQSFGSRCRAWIASKDLWLMFLCVLIAYGSYQLNVRTRLPTTADPTHKHSREAGLRLVGLSGMVVLGTTGWLGERMSPVWLIMAALVLQGVPVHFVLFLGYYTSLLVYSLWLLSYSIIFVAASSHIISIAEQVGVQPDAWMHALLLMILCLGTWSGWAIVHLAEARDCYGMATATLSMCCFMLVPVIYFGSSAAAKQKPPTVSSQGDLESNLQSHETEK